MAAMKGNLIISKGAGGDWQKKWFVLFPDHGALMYFVNEAASSVGIQGSNRIALGDETVILRGPAVSDPATPHVFQVTSELGNFFLCAESAALLQQWTAALERAIRGAANETKGTLYLATPKKPKPWSSRWCILSPDAKTLSIYKKKSSVVRNRPHVIALSTGRLEFNTRMAVKNPPTEFLFQLTLADRAYVFCVKSGALRQKWMESMATVLGVEPPRPTGGMAAAAGAASGAAATGRRGSRMRFANAALTAAKMAPVATAAPQRWDMALVFKHPLPEDATEYQRYFCHDRVVDSLTSSGLWVTSFYSSARDEIYVKVAGPTRRLLQEAERTDYLLQLDETTVTNTLAQEVADAATGEVRREAVVVEHDPTGPRSFYKRSPWQDCFARYTPSAHVQGLYRRHGNGTILSQVDRLRLLYSIISSGCSLNLDLMVLNEALDAHFPLHDASFLERLHYDYTRICVCCTCCRTGCCCCKKEDPSSSGHKVVEAQHRLTEPKLDTVRVYFGEKMALYFAFVKHFTTWMWVPGLLGIPLTVQQVYTGVIVPVTATFFAIMIVMWATVIMEAWKRKEATYAMEWGMTEFEDQESARLEFAAAPGVAFINSPVHGHKIAHFSRGLATIRLIGSALTMATMFLLVLCGVWAVFMFKFYALSINPGVFFGFGSQLAGVLNSVQIMVMAHIWSIIAHKLNDWETHRTDTQYEDHLIVKTFMFQFINHYTALFYIAFVKGHFPIIPGNPAIDQCSFNRNCPLELAEQLAIIFLVQLFVSNITEVAVPYFTNKMKVAREAKKAAAVAAENNEYAPLNTAGGSTDGGTAATVPVGPEPVSAVEAEYEKDEYEMLELIDDYQEIVIQFGYVTLFVTAFPLAPFLALLSNFMEQKVDMMKLLINSRRPFPRGACDIGTWQDMLVILGTVAVVTNAAFFVFTAPLGQHALGYSPNAVWLFVGVEHLVLGMKYLADVIIPDVPADVTLQLQRQEFVRGLLIDLTEDEVEDEIVADGKMGAAADAPPRAVVLDRDTDALAGAHNTDLGGGLAAAAAAGAGEAKAQ